MKKLLMIVLAIALTLVPLFAGGSSESATVPENPDVNGSVKVTKGGTLTIATTADAASMLPTVIRSPTNLYYASACFETLMNFDANGVPQPFLAESVTENVSNLTYTIELKKGILFHDGTELTAEVCKWNIDHYKAEGVLSTSFYSKLESVEVAGPYTVVLHLSSWDSAIPNALARECGYMSSKEAYERGAKGFDEKPV